MNENLRQQLLLVPDYLSLHLVITLLALAIGISISLPLGVLAHQRRSMREPVLGLVSAIQTIPGLALLALMVALFSQIGFWPALAALVMYSMLPVLRNTVTGLEEIEPEIVESARGIGMTSGQILRGVRFPLAMPVIIAGIRTATVWTVGMATLTTPVGQTSLGNFIFSGLHTQNYTAVMVGCVAAAVLAMVLDGLIRLLQLAAERRKPLLNAVAFGLIAVVILGGTAPLMAFPGTSERGEKVVVGALGFTEQYIMARLIAAELEEAGFNAEVRDNLGFAVLFPATANGTIDCYLEYSGTVWANYMNKTDNPGKDAIYEQATQWLDETHGMATLGSFGFENRYGIAMRREDAERRGISTIEDLAEESDELTLGTDMEFLARPEWPWLRDPYDLTFRAKKSFEPALMYAAVKEGQVDVISAYTTDGRIDAYDLVLLEDPRSALLPYDALLVVSPESRKSPKFIAAIEDLVEAIPVEAMREANRMVDVDGKSLDEAVRYLQTVVDED